MQRMFAKVQEELDRERSSYLYVQDRRPASRTVVGPLPPLREYVCSALIVPRRNFEEQIKIDTEVVW